MLAGEQQANHQPGHLLCKKNEKKKKKKSKSSTPSPFFLFAGGGRATATDPLTDRFIFVDICFFAAMKLQSESISSDIFFFGRIFFSQTLTGNFVFCRHEPANRMHDLEALKGKIYYIYHIYIYYIYNMYIIHAYMT